MPSGSLTTTEDVADFVRGSLFFGAGGSCLPDRAAASLRRALDDGHRIRWIDLDDVPEDALVFSAFAAGSTAPRTDETFTEMSRIGLSEENEVLDINAQLYFAVERLHRLVGRPLQIAAAPETSDSTNAATLVAAAQHGALAVDGAYLSRAIPALTMCRFALAGLEPCPLVTVDGWGNTSIIERSFNAASAELMLKLASQAGFGLVGGAGLVTDRAGLLGCLTRGTLTMCLEVGRQIREAARQAGDLADNLVSATDSIEICRGEVTGFEATDRDGYYSGSVTIDGGDALYRTWFMNETFVVWRDEQPCATGPDLITAIDLSSAEPLANQATRVGMEVVLVARATPEASAYPSLAAALGPDAFGFDFGPQLVSGAW